VKKWLVLALVLVGLLIYSVSSRYGMRLGPVRLSWAPDKHAVETRIFDFLEGIQFKDFERAARVHSEKDQEGRNIPELIEKKFMIKPELLDIKSFEIVHIDLTHAGERAKVLTKVHVMLLNSGEPIKEIEAVFYFKRAEGQWVMDLQSSL
jgi:hypothetical protein